MFYSVSQPFPRSFVLPSCAISPAVGSRVPFISIPWWISGRVYSPAVQPQLCSYCSPMMSGTCRAPRCTGSRLHSAVPAGTGWSRVGSHVRYRLSLVYLPIEVQLSAAVPALSRPCSSRCVHTVALCIGGAARPAVPPLSARWRCLWRCCWWRCRFRSVPVGSGWFRSVPVSPNRPISGLFSH